MNSRRFCGAATLLSPIRPNHGIDRRSFIQRLGGGLAVLLLVDPRSLEATERQSGGPGEARATPDPGTIAAWLHIGADGMVSIYTGKTEVGQNIRTSLTQAVTEELPVPISSIRMVMADTDLVPFDRGTFGSLTTPQMSPQLRQAAASAREVLLGLAAEHFGVDRSELRFAEGRIHSEGGGRSISIGELAQGKELTQTILVDIALQPAHQWKVMGTSVPKVDGHAFVTGKHRFTSDLNVPGMRYGAVLRPAGLGATLESLDASTAERMRGVTVVREGDFAGVVADDSQRARSAIAALRATWREVPQVSSDALFEHLRASARSGSDRGRGATGSIDEGLAEADHRVEHTYTIAFIAHAPLEPRAAVAVWKDDRVTVWTGTQRPFGVRSEVARELAVPESRVRIIVPDTGSGYGGKHTGEAAIEAAKLARAAGSPVKIVWSREDEFTWAYARPAGVIDVRAGVRDDGTLTAWQFRNINSGPSGLACPYRCANKDVAFSPSDPPLRQGSYRALASTANHFARESHIDDLARAIGMDPLEFRLKNIEEARLRAVVEEAAKAFGWREFRNGGGRGAGIACGTEKGSFIATCAEVEADVSTGAVRVVRAVSAYECGAIVNPVHLLNQVDGAIAQGIGGALFEELRFSSGRMLNARFSQYRVPRFRDIPRLETHLVNRPDLPSVGAGETPIIGIAPAIRNAIAAATDIRLRALPMIPHGLNASA